jgi:F-type H+-transporting ATPase subunit epsilon
MAEQDLENKVAFELVTPTALVHGGAFDMVVVPGEEGDFGVLRGHTPFLSTVRPGVIDVHDGGAVTARLFVEGGFAEATPERCTVLAEAALPVEDIDAARAQERLEAARAALAEAGDDGRDAAEAELQIAEAQVAAVGGSRGE